MRADVREFVQTYNMEKGELEHYSSDIVEEYEGDIADVVAAGTAVETEIEERFRNRARDLEDRDGIDRDEGLEPIGAIFAYDIQDRLRRSVVEALPEENTDDYIAAVMEEDLSEEERLAEQYGSLTDAARHFSDMHDTYVFRPDWRTYLREEEAEEHTADFDILRSFGIGQKYQDELGGE